MLRWTTLLEFCGGGTLLSVQPHSGLQFFRQFIIQKVLLLPRPRLIDNSQLGSFNRQASIPLHLGPQAEIVGVVVVLRAPVPSAALGWLGGTADLRLFQLLEDVQGKGLLVQGAVQVVLRAYLDRRGPGFCNRVHLILESDSIEEFLSLLSVEEMLLVLDNFLKVTLLLLSLIDDAAGFDGRVQYRRTRLYQYPFQKVLGINNLQVHCLHRLVQFGCCWTPALYVILMVFKPVIFARAVYFMRQSLVFI